MGGPAPGYGGYPQQPPPQPGYGQARPPYQQQPVYQQRPQPYPPQFPRQPYPQPEQHWQPNVVGIVLIVVLVLTILGGIGFGIMMVAANG